MSFLTSCSEASKPFQPSRKPEARNLSETFSGCTPPVAPPKQPPPGVSPKGPPEPATANLPPRATAAVQATRPRCSASSTTTKLPAGYIPKPSQALGIRQGTNEAGFRSKCCPFQTLGRYNVPAKATPRASSATQVCCQGSLVKSFGSSTRGNPWTFRRETAAFNAGKCHGTTQRQKSR